MKTLWFEFGNYILTGFKMPITKFKSQGLYIIKIKYWNASGSGFPSSLIPALWDMGILQ